MIAIIQARSSSKRFKNKVLHSIKNKQLILHVVDSIKKSKKISTIIVATSNLKSDDNLVKLLKSKKIKIFRGGLKNVALRLSRAAQKYKIKNFLRVSGDSPVIDYKIIDKAIRLFNKYPNYDLITNVFPKTFPSGQSVEIINTQILFKSLKKMNSLEKEHVTLYFYNNYKKFLIKNFRNTGYYDKKNNCSVDKISDLKKIIKILNEKKT